MRAARRHQRAGVVRRLTTCRFTRRVVYTSRGKLIRADARQALEEASASLAKADEALAAAEGDLLG